MTKWESLLNQGRNRSCGIKNPLINSLELLGHLLRQILRRRMQIYSQKAFQTLITIQIRMVIEVVSLSESPISIVNTRLCVLEPAHLSRFDQYIFLLKYTEPFMSLLMNIELPTA